MLVTRADEHHNLNCAAGNGVMYEPSTSGTRGGGAGNLKSSMSCVKQRIVKPKAVDGCQERALVGKYGERVEA